MATEEVTAEAVPEVAEADEVDKETEEGEDLGNKRPEDPDMPPSLLKAAVIAITFTELMLGTVWNPTPVPGKIAAPPRPEGQTSLARTRNLIINHQNKVK